MNPADPYKITSKCQMRSDTTMILTVGVNPVPVFGYARPWANAGPRGPLRAKRGDERLRESFLAKREKSSWGVGGAVSPLNGVGGGAPKIFGFLSFE